MTPQDQSILAWGQEWIILSTASALPVMWALALILHFARPYVLRRASGEASRLSVEVSWILYVVARDGAMVATFVAGTIFVFPGVYLSESRDLPIGAPLAWLVLLWALLIKMTGDADRNVGRFRAVSLLLVVGAVLAIVPEASGVQAIDASYYWDVFGGVGWVAPALIASLNPEAASGILAFTLIAFCLTAVVAFVLLVTRADPVGATPPAGEGSS